MFVNALRSQWNRPITLLRGFCKKNNYIYVYYLRIENAEGYVLIAVYLIIYLFVCVLFA